MYRSGARGPEVLLVHPGGPYWARKDARAWSIPKGEYAEGEDPLTASIREFEEETGFRPQGHFVPLGDIRQPGGKTVIAWAIESDFDVAALRSNAFEMKWPPRSGRTASFPEVDRAQWFSLAAARRKILPAQAALIDRLEVAIHDAGGTVRRT
jgi:predicted NUDIX family NTP pyrophosphohydrolase